MSENFFISICIPSYNRPEELKRLILSVDASSSSEIEIVVTEDKAPKRKQIHDVIEELKTSVPYHISYYENESNFGYDKNLRNCASKAKGKWVIFMGDDDVFVQGSLDKFIDFLKLHDDLGYVLRRYYSEYSDGRLEDTRYDNKDVFLEPSVDSYIEFFRRSVFISGFTYKREYFNDYECSDYDGTLLFQLYIQALICMKYPSAYCDIPISKSIEGGIPYFGSSENEKNYVSGSNTVGNSIEFMSQVRKLAESIDQKCNIKSVDKIMLSYSKYSYGFLHEHRNDGVKIFTEYAKELKKLGFAQSKLFYVYYLGLLILGKKGCQNLIMFIKKVLGKTPKL